jgi:hypothetical protein
MLEQQGQPTADFSNILCFDAPARFLKSQAEAGHLLPGTPLEVTGRLEQQTWTDRTTGALRSAILLRAREVRFAGRQRSLKQDPERRLSFTYRLPFPTLTERAVTGHPITGNRPGERCHGFLGGGSGSEEEDDVNQKSA